MENPNIVPQEKWYLKNSKSGSDKPSLLYEPNLSLLLFCSPAALQWLHTHPTPCCHVVTVIYAFIRSQLHDEAVLIPML